MKKNKNIGIILFEVFMTFLVISVGYLAFHHMEEEQRVEHEYTLMLEYATRLKDSSEELTRFARMYVMTSEKKYKDQYYKVLNIRKGLTYRPEDYNWYYWYNKNKKNTEEKLSKISLLSLMKSVSFTEKDLEMLSKSEEYSDQLAKLEVEAFRIVDKNPLDLVKARKLLHSESYEEAKNHIMHGIGAFTGNVKIRTERIIEEHSEGIRSNVIFLSISMTIFMLGNILIYLYLTYQEKVLAKTKDQLVETAKLAQIGKLAAGVGHEINNPLAVILGNLTLLKERLKPTAVVDIKMIERVNKIEMACKRIGNIIDSLRVYSQSNADKTQILDLTNLLRETHRILEDIYLIDSISVSLNVPDEQIFVLASQSEMQQILINTISNARDAVQDSNKKEIAINLLREDSKVTIEVSDTGCGIAKENLNKIFEPFYTTKDVGKGSGIGLGISNELVKKFGGKIGIDSELNAGTTVSINLPLESAEPISEIKIDDSLVKYTKSELKTVLVVEDEEDVREFVVLFLEDYGYEVDQACDGVEGIEMILEKEYDIVCTDIKMPNLRGDELITRAREIENRKTKFVIMTGGVELNGKTDAQKLRDLCDNLIYKPFDKEKLYAALEKVEKV